MGARRTCWRGTRLALGALLVCLVAVGCESWFRSGTATPEPSPATTVKATAEPTALPDVTSTAISPIGEPATPVPPSEGDYPYPVELPEPGDLPEYPEAYPSE